jgi:hypothetical protein
MGSRQETHSDVLGVSAEFGGQVAQRQGPAGAHGRDVHIRLHLPILHCHLHACKESYDTSLPHSAVIWCVCTSEDAEIRPL